MPSDEHLHFEVDPRVVERIRLQLQERAQKAREDAQGAPPGVTQKLDSGDPSSPAATPDSTRRPGAGRAQDPPAQYGQRADAAQQASSPESLRFRFCPHCREYRVFVPETERCERCGRRAG
jgi:hypothetical protein